MTHRVLYIGRWVVDFLFASEHYDVEEVLSYMYELDVPFPIMSRIKEILVDDMKNTGFTYADPELMTALVVIGPTSSGAEFIDTLTHEVHHLAVIIADNLGIDLESETPAYLAGDSVRELADVVCFYGCSRCRRDEAPDFN